MRPWRFLTTTKCLLGAASIDMVAASEADDSRDARIEQGMGLQVLIIRAHHSACRLTSQS